MQIRHHFLLDRQRCLGDGELDFQGLATFGLPGERGFERTLFAEQILNL